MMCSTLLSAVIDSQNRVGGGGGVTSGTDNPVCRSGQALRWLSTRNGSIPIRVSILFQSFGLSVDIDSRFAPQ